MLNVEGLIKLVPLTSVRNVSGNNTQLLQNVVLFFIIFSTAFPSFVCEWVPFFLQIN
jgi:hypothetical protein